MSLIRTSALTTIHEVLSDLGWDNPKNFTEETTLSDKLDSIEILEFAIKLERKLNIHISDSDIENWTTVSDIIDSIIDYTTPKK